MAFTGTADRPRYTTRRTVIGGSVPSYVPTSGSSSPVYSGSVPRSGPRTASQAEKDAWAANAGGKQQYYDQYGTATVTDVNMATGQPRAVDLLYMGLPPGDLDANDGGGGGGGRYGGGGGAAGGITPEQKAAYKAIWNQQMGNAIDLGAGFDKYEAGLRKAYDPSVYDPLFDKARTGVTEAGTAGRERLGPILQTLLERAATGRTAVNDAFQAGQSRLEDLRNRFGGMGVATNDAINNSLAAFDAGTVAPTGQDNLNNMFAASMVGNEGARSAFDAALADRPAAYEGLNADVLSGITRDETGLLNRIAQQQAAAGIQSQQQLNQSLASAGLQRLQAEMARRAEQDRLRLEMAQLGLIPPDSFTGSWNA